MKKATALLLATGGILALVGAGCNSSQDQTQTTDTNTDQTQTSTPSVDTSTPTNPTSDNPSSTEATAGFTVVVNPIASGAEVSWTVPDSVSKTNSFRVMHSARPNPSFSSTPDPKSPNAYWTQYMNSTRTTTLNGVPKGKRYFRVCEFDTAAQQCVKYSNEVTVQVP